MSPKKVDRSYRMLSVLFQKRDVMEEHMLIVILPCLLQLGFLLNFSYTL